MPIPSEAQEPFSSPTSGNRLLDSLSFEKRTRFLQSSERIAIPLRTMIAEIDEPSRQIHFPISCVFSSVIPLADGSIIEAATIGREGMTGIDLLADKPTSSSRVIQQVEGESYRISTVVFRGLLAEESEFEKLMWRYAMTLLRQSGQTAACNLRHSVEERMCRWLLMTHDRVTRPEFILTQEFLGTMLGVRRQSVGLIAATLQQAGLITYRRGLLRITDREGLEAAACECYFTVRDAYDKTMGTGLSEQ